MRCLECGADTYIIGAGNMPICATCLRVKEEKIHEKADQRRGEHDICGMCGANLDIGERCDCDSVPRPLVDAKAKVGMRVQFLDGTAWRRNGEGYPEEGTRGTIVSSSFVGEKRFWHVRWVGFKNIPLGVRAEQIAEVRD